MKLRESTSSSPDISPLSTEAVLGIHRNDLKPEVRKYADNLRDQIRKIFADHGVKSVDEFSVAARMKKISFDTVKAVQGLLNQLREVVETGKIPEQAHLIVVHNALNPYREALLEGGITDSTENPERMDRVIDLQKIQKKSAELYLDEALLIWGENVHSADLTLLTPDKRQRIESLVKDGWEPIAIMPGKNAQLRSLKEALQILKPLWIKDTFIQDTDNPCLFPDYLTLIDREAEGLTKDVPERPYLLLTPPTQKPPDWTCNKTPDEQITALIDHQRTTPGVHVMNPAEYATTQAQCTRRLHAIAADAGKILTTLNPLDTTTWTRFINLRVSSGRDVPHALWDPVSKELVFGRGNKDSRNSEEGFRLVVRIEL